ncbi:MAG: glycosyltransferase family 9 protein [Desulfobulbaceae bacterium]|jgi:lipopolysaccharide heptosyltransferase I|nr:glycosyltransferase family 9 protein [Desulfobulbaceae bacterium]MDY0351235.1 glycosyltransferase family 9 protein [Desulfobulbaceae bacterium]
MDPRDKRILILKPSSLGDIIHTLPVVHALKRCAPGCSIGWVVQKAYAAIPESDPAVDRVYPIAISSTSDPAAGRLAYWRALRDTVAALSRLRGQFRSRPYDIVLDLHASFRSGLIGMANPGGTRIGFADAREMNTLFQHRRLPVPPTLVHALDKNLLFCTALGCPPKKEDLYLCSGEPADSRVTGFLEGRGVPPDDSLVYIQPAARWATKFWLRERWAELADRLLGRPETRVVFGGGRGDRACIDAIVEAMRLRPVVAAGELNLAETASLLKRSTLYIGLDSGPMHMAAMAGTPVVALFGPTHPERVGPYGVEHVIVRAPGLDCLGCRKRRCDHMECMRGISVDMVHEAALRLLPPVPEEE